MDLEDERLSLFKIASAGPTSVPELSERIVAHTHFTFKR